MLFKQTEIGWWIYLEIRRRLRMKLEMNTAYRAKTQEQFNKILEQADKQGICWIMGDKATDNKNYWRCRRENTVVCVEESGLTTWSEADATASGRYKIADFVEEPSVVQINPWCVRVDALNYETAQTKLSDWLNSFMRKTNEEMIENMFSEKCYTVRVDGRNVTVITPDGKTATAKCHPDDDFDLAEGIRVALEKIERQKHKLTEKEYNILEFLANIDCDTMYIDQGVEIIGKKGSKHIIELSEDYIDDCFDWLEDYEEYDVDELLELDVED